MKNKRNLVTGITMSKRDDTEIYNPITGTFRKVDDSDNRQFTKSERTLWPTITGQENDEDGDEDFEKRIPIFVSKAADEQIVYGIVYEPDVVDAQGEQANAEEIRKAAYSFMENAQNFKVMHKGKNVKVQILENYIAPQDLEIEKRQVKKGTWVLVTRVLDKGLWKAIKDGKFTGYSMAGHAKVTESE